MTLESQERKAFLAPFLSFMGLLGVSQVLQSIFGGGRIFLLTDPQYLFYPLQTVVCGAILIRYWPLYKWKRLGKTGAAVGIGAGLLALAIWIAPQYLALSSPRLNGFNPMLFRNNDPLFLAVVGLRFLRCVVVVPLLEEIFWRGFLLRELIHPDFTKVPFGSFSWASFSIVTVGFCLEHSPADWPAALLTGALYNLVAYRTRSLAACVLAHAVTNLILGIYVMETKQWGFW